MLRLNVSCAVVVEVVLKLKLVVHVVNSQLHLTGFQPDSVAVQPNLLTFAAPTFYRLIQHMMHITAHGCVVWGVLPRQPATYVVFSLDCVDICTIHYTLYTMYTLVCFLRVLEEEDCPWLHSHSHMELEI